MKFDIVTLFPEDVYNACNFSIIKRALNAGTIKINTVNPRDYTLDKHRKVDDTPYGGGAGMLLACQPYIDAIKSIEKHGKTKTIILSPQGQIYNQEKAKELATYDDIILICGHYEGFDDRIKQITQAEEISLGDFVMTGGEFPALCIMDSVIRLLPDILGNEESAEYDSHYDGLLEHPHYTKPRVFENLEVPEILLSGNHEKIKEWRRIQQFKVTKRKRPDLFEIYLNNPKSDYDENLLKKFEKEIFED